MPTIRMQDQHLTYGIDLSLHNVAPSHVRNQAICIALRGLSVMRDLT